MALLETTKVTGNLDVTGTINGNATSANKLKTARKINGVDFDGSADINIDGAHIIVNSVGTEYASRSKLQFIGATVTDVPNSDITKVEISTLDSTKLPLSGGTMTGAINSMNIIPKANTTYNLGSSDAKYSNVYATTFNGNLSGNATSANSATTATSARKLTTAQTIDGVSFDGSAAITHYGTCDTAAATADKTVNCAGFTLVTGAVIYVRFTVTNTAAVANLTLNVNGTGAKGIKYRNADLPSAGDLAANRTYCFVYDGTYYQFVGDRDANDNTYDRIKYAQNIKAGTTAIVAANLIVASSTDQTYTHLKLGNSFDITKPILYAASAISASGTGNNNYICIPFTVTTTQSTTLTAYKPVYAKGTLDGTKFTPISAACLTQAVPTSADGYQYILIGTAYSTTAIYLEPYHPIFEYSNGKFQKLGGSSESALKVYSTLTNPTSSTTYQLQFASNASSGNKDLRNNNGVGYNTLEGTTSAVGIGRLILGNSTASGTAGNKQGYIRLHGQNTGYTDITYANSTSSVTNTLPATSGTVLNSGTTSFTQNQATGKKIGSIKINNSSTDVYAPIDSSNSSITNFITMTSEDYSSQASSLPDKTVVAIIDGTEGKVTTRSTGLTCELPLDL